MNFFPSHAYFKKNINWIKTANGKFLNSGRCRLRGRGTEGFCHHSSTWRYDATHCSHDNLYYEEAISHLQD